MRKLKILGTALLLATTGAGAALAHATMTSSVPKDGATVASPLTAIEFSFSKPLRLTMVDIVRASDQQHVTIAKELPGTAGPSAKVAVNPLTAGSYKVSWTAVGDDGHVMKGNFSFSVSEGNTAPPKQ